MATGSDQINWNAITGIAASASAIFAIISAYVANLGVKRQDERARLTLGIELITKFEDRFVSQRMIEARKYAASVLLSDLPFTDLNYSKVDEVLDFFETIALLSREKIVNDKYVWHTFFTCMRGYFQAAREYIRNSQSEDPGFWKDLCRLYERLVAIEILEGRREDRDIELTSVKVTEFLMHEAAL